MLSKSESRIISLRASIRAAAEACKTSSRPSSDLDKPAAEDGEPLADGPPSSRKTSQTLSCAGNGIDRLKSVRYQRVPNAVVSIPKSF